MYLGYVRPTEALKRATIALLRCRSPKKMRRLEAQAHAARTRLTEFSKWWLEMAARVTGGKAGPRARGYFDELAELLVSARERELIDEVASDLQRKHRRAAWAGSEPKARATRFLPYDV